MQATETEKLALTELVLKSLHQYREMAELLRTLEKNLAADPAGYVDEFNVSFAELKIKAQYVDKSLLERLKSSGKLDSTIEDYLDERRRLLADISNLLERALPQALSIKTLLQNEMQSLKTGRNALSGYKSNPSGHGRLINKRS